MGDDHPHTGKAIQNLAYLYHGCKKPDKAADWRVKLDDDTKPDTDAVPRP